MRILVTGSRRWRDLVLIRSALLRAVREVPWEVKPTVVNGGQVDWDPALAEYVGADYLATVAAAQLGFAIETYPANWSLGRKAGPLRNQAMVALGADLCLAFPMGESRGTRGCMALAEAAGIPVVEPLSAWPLDTR